MKDMMTCSAEDGSKRARCVSFRENVTIHHLGIAVSSLLSNDEKFLLWYSDEYLLLLHQRARLRALQMHIRKGLQNVQCPSLSKDDLQDGERGLEKIFSIERKRHKSAYMDAFMSIQMLLKDSSIDEKWNLLSEVSSHLSSRDFTNSATKGMSDYYDAYPEHDDRNNNILQQISSSSSDEKKSEQESSTTITSPLINDDTNLDKTNNILLNTDVKEESTIQPINTFEKDTNLPSLSTLSERDSYKEEVFSEIKEILSRTFERETDVDAEMSYDYCVPFEGVDDDEVTTMSDNFGFYWKDENINGKLDHDRCESKNDTLENLLIDVYKV